MYIEYYLKTLENDETVKYTVYNDYDDLLEIINDTNWRDIMIYIDDKFDSTKTFELYRKFKIIYKTNNK